MLLEPVHAGRRVPCPACGLEFDAPRELIPVPTAPGHVHSRNARVALVLSVVGIVATGLSVLTCCGLTAPLGVLGPIALILTSRDVSAERRASREPEPALVSAHRVAKIATVVFVLPLAAAILIAVFATGMAAFDQWR